MLIFCAAVAAASADALILGAQQPRPTFRTGVELIQVEVVAVDAAGVPVRGLTAADFTLLDAGVRRDIAIFEEFSRPPVAGTAAPLPVSFVRDVSDNRAPGSDRLIVLAIDDLVPGDRYEQLETLGREIVERVGDRAAMALLFTSGAPRIEATTDLSEILRGIDGISERSYRAPLNARTLRHETGACANDILRGVAESLRVDDRRRKAVIYISPYCDATGQKDSEYTLWMLEALRQANVAFYGVDPRGPAGYSLGNFPAPDLVSVQAPAHLDTSVGGPVWPEITTRSWDPVLNSQKSLRWVTEQTGGFAVTDTAELSDGLARVVSDFDHYYTLGFYPGEDPGTKFRQIDLTSWRPGLTLRYRRGYQPGRSRPEPRSRDALGVASETVLPRSNLAMRLLVTPVPAGTPDSKLVLTLEVTAPAGWPRPVAEDVDLLIVAADLEASKVSRTHRETRHIDLRGAEAGDRLSYQVVTTLDLRPGRYQLRVSAKSAAFDAAGSVYRSVSIPRPGASGGVDLGGVLIGFDDANRLPASAVSAKEGAVPFAPVLAREFATDETLRVYVPFLRRSSADLLRARIELLDSTGRVVRSLDVDQPAGRASGALDGRLPLADLAPGAYRLRARGGAAGAEAIREVGLQVREPR